MNSFWKNLAAVVIPAGLTFGTAWAQGATTKQGTGAAITAVLAALAGLHTTAPADAAALTTVTKS